MCDDEGQRAGEPPPLETVLEARDAVEAELVRGILEDAGIPVLVESYQIPWYDGIMTAATGSWGRVLVPAPMAAQAREALAAYFEGPPASEES